MEKSVIIVGAGIAGLSAGCYARMNGYDARIFEMHQIPGGLCTAWKKKGYTFDISMHMLTGSYSGPFHRMWEELGITSKFKFYYHDQISIVEGMGKKLKLSTNRRELEEGMKAISPGDSKLIEEFIRIIFGPNLINAASLNPPELSTIFSKIRSLPKILPLLPFFIKYGNVSIQQFAARFKDSFLREAVRFFIDAPGWPMPDFPIVAMTGYIQSSITEAGVPLGGSQKVALHTAELFKQLGGTITYNSRVTGLISENDKITGIRLTDGKEYRADYVIWAGDGHTLHFDVLGGNYLDDKITRMYATWKPVMPVIQILMGVNRDLSGEAHRITFEMDEPLKIGDRRHTWMTVFNRCFDKSMSPEGKSEVEVWFDTEYYYWEKLYQDKEKYQAEKKRIADHVIRILEKRWPGFTSQIEVIDVPTPVTYTRYTGNWKGSPDGWYLTMDNLGTMKPLRQIQGLQGLYMAGQWTSPFTGTVIAALSGRQIVQLICKKDGKKFKTNTMLQKQVSKKEKETAEIQ